MTITYILYCIPANFCNSFLDKTETAADIQTTSSGLSPSLPYLTQANKSPNVGLVNLEQLSSGKIAL